MVSVPEEHSQAFFAYLDANGYDHSLVEREDLEIPEWQKELVRSRIAASKPEDYHPWEEVRERVRNAII